MPRKKKVCRKIPFQSKEIALAARARMKRHIASVAGVYRCDICRTKDGRRLWHIGHLHFNRYGHRRPR